MGLVPIQAMLAMMCTNCHTEARGSAQLMWRSHLSPQSSIAMLTATTVVVLAGATSTRSMLGQMMQQLALLMLHPLTDVASGSPMANKMAGAIA